MNQVELIYNRLLSSFGPQGWWPMASRAGKGPFDKRGYAPGLYSHPSSEEELLEVCVGAILTQNTSWTNVEKAISNLLVLDLIDLRALNNVSHEKLSNTIRPAGYFNQKAKKLKLFVEKVLEQGSLSRFLKRESLRDDLLSCWGIGPETADSIVLYAAKRPSFVIDAYTKRIMSRVGLCEESASYDEIQARFQESLEPDQKVFNEYHALLVELAKRNCTKSKPKCESCPVSGLCSFSKSSS